MKMIYGSFIGLLCYTASYSQNSAVSGQVTGPGGTAPLKGVTISAPGLNPVTTDDNGNFTLPCADSLVITIHQPGFETITRKLGCGQTLRLELAPAGKSLDEVEITATSIDNKQLLYQPQSIAKLQEAELKRGTGLFLDDAINLNVPGVFMERRTLSAGQQFNIRGYGNGARGTSGVNSNFDGQGYKVYLNNIPITDAEGITLMDDIDFGSIGNVEVTKGPAGTLYGLAIAGAVQLATAPAEKNKVSIGQDALLGSYGLQRYTTHLRIGGSHSSLLLNYGKQKYDGFMPHTASHKDFVNLAGDVKLSDRQTIGTYLGYSNSYDERNGELTIGQYDTLNYSGNPSYIRNNAHSGVISIRAGVSHTYKLTKQVSNVTSLFGSGINSNVSSAGGWTDKQPLNYGLRSSFNTKFSLGEKSGLSGITGLELQRQDAQTIGYAMVADSSNLAGYNLVGAMRSNQATISKTASYFTEWTLTLPADLQLTAGVGLSTMAIELNDRLYVPANNRPPGKIKVPIPTQYEASYNNMVSPHFAINKVFSKMLSVYAAYSKGYKAPVSAYFFIPTTGEVNKVLKPEAGEQVEIGTKGSLLKDRLQYQLAVFDAVFYNKMTAVAVPLNSVTTAYSYMVNGGQQRHRGLEVLLKATAFQRGAGFLRTLKPFVNFCYSDFKYNNFRFQTLNAARTSVIVTDYSNNVVAGVPPVTAGAGLDLLMAYGLYANVNFLYRDAMYFTSDNLNKTKSYSLLNARIGMRRLLGRHFEMDAYAGASNITGTQYYYMIFLNQLPDAYLAAPNEINFFGGLNLKYIF